MSVTRIWLGALEGRLHEAGTKECEKNARKLVGTGLKTKAQELLEILAEGPSRHPPAFEKLIGDLKGTYSRRINIQHRLVYQVLEEESVVKVVRLWTHYE